MFAKWINNCYIYCLLKFMCLPILFTRIWVYSTIYKVKFLKQFTKVSEMVSFPSQDFSLPTAHHCVERLSVNVAEQYIGFLIFQLKNICYLLNRVLYR